MINLSIAIPTLNRLRYLQKTLCHMELFSGINDLNVNYCISAASCIDGTQDYLKLMAESKNNFHINIKPSSRTRWNWIYLSKLIPSDADWVWLFGDDDIILHEDGWLPVKKLIDLAEINDADIISIPQSKRVNVEEIHIESLINLSSRFGVHEILGWMTSIIMRRSVFINLMSSMKERFRSVYTDKGMQVTRVSPFFHSLILLKYNKNCKTILALQKIVDEQVIEEDKISYTTAAREAEFLKDRLPYTFAEFKDLILLQNESKNISFFRYVNKTFIDLFINIIAENIIQKRSIKVIKNNFEELMFLINRLNSKSGVKYIDPINTLCEIIGSKDIHYFCKDPRVIEIFINSKKDYLGYFIGDKLFFEGS